MQIPAPTAVTLAVRYAPLSDRDVFDPMAWASRALPNIAAAPGWWDFDPSALGLPDGDYEYEFILDGDARHPIADPYAQEITRFGGYRGIFRLRDGALWAPPFRWDNEIPDRVTLPQNNQLVIYEMPLRRMDAGSEVSRQVDLGTFDEVIFEKLDSLADLGINAIELLPVMDSRDTLSWGYGTRFFFAPDIDVGVPVDARIFVKRCHQRGIRVFLDIVMNHHRDCPLARLAEDWFFLRNPADEDRNAQFGELFRYRPAADGTRRAQDFMLKMADHWIQTYHIDGFRIDAFGEINNWDFVQDFRDHVWQTHQAAFAGRPFFVVAEDPAERAQAAQNDASNRKGRKIVDAIWGFRFRDEIRRLFYNAIITEWQRDSRRQRLKWLISGETIWDDMARSSKPGANDLAEVVNYITSHDVADYQGMRFMNYLAGGTLSIRKLIQDNLTGRALIETVRDLSDSADRTGGAIKAAHDDALEWVRSGFVILMTAVGIPMFLAGEEFADVHDVQYSTDDKMSDPVNWPRQDQPSRAALRRAVRELIRLRTSNDALQRNEVDFFYAHPNIDLADGERVFAYCRTNGRGTGQANQVVIIVNAGPQNFRSFAIPWVWPNGGPVPREVGAPAGIPPIVTRPGQAVVSLAPFQARVFTT